MPGSGLNQQIQDELKSAWDRDKAAANMDRWLAVCKKEGWGKYPENIFAQMPEHRHACRNRFGTSEKSAIDRVSHPQSDCNQAGGA